MKKPKDKAWWQQDEDAARAHRNMKVYGALTVVAIIVFALIVVYAVYTMFL